MWMNVALLFLSVTSMLLARILLALIVVPVKLDFLETEKHAPVREYKNNDVSSLSFLWDNSISSLTNHQATESTIFRNLKRESPSGVQQAATARR